MDEFYDSVNNVQSQNPERKNAFLSEKMDCITKKIYDLVSLLSKYYYSKQCYPVDKESQRKINCFFEPPTFLIDSNVQHKPFYVFQKQPDSFDQQLMSRPEAVNNYVNEFMSCLSLLFSENNFFEFVIENDGCLGFDRIKWASTNDDGLKIFRNIICSDFACDKADIELFEESSFLKLPEALFDSKTFDKIQKYLIHQEERLVRNAKRMKEIILSYLKKASAISPKIIALLLGDYHFYELFEDDNEIEQIIIDAIGKTYFKPGTSLYHDNRGGKNCLKEFDKIIQESIAAKQSHEDQKNSVYKQAIKGHDETKTTKKQCFYLEKKDQMQPALINKLADIFSNEKTNQYIDLEDLFCVYPSVAEFMLSYCQENKESEASVKLFNGLKTWLEYRMNDGNGFYELKSNFKKIIFENESLLKLFALNDELKRTFVNVCKRAITEDIDLHYALLADREHAKNINSFLSTFKINLDKTKRNHCNDVKDLAIEIIIIAICIFAMIFGFIIIPVVLAKFFMLILLVPVYKLLCQSIYICQKIENDRIYNAIYNISKLTTKQEARNRISFDMFWRKEVKYYFNQLPESENAPDEIIINN